MIVDWDFIKEQPLGDGKLVADSLIRLTEHYGKPKSYSADRGFDAEMNRNKLKEQTIFNAICPRSVPSLKERLADDEFCRLQKTLRRNRGPYRYLQKRLPWNPSEKQRL